MNRLRYSRALVLVPREAVVPNIVAGARDRRQPAQGRERIQRAQLGVGYVLDRHRAVLLQTTIDMS
jgi:hypothetical protein